MEEEDTLEWTTQPLKFISSTFKCPTVTLDHMWDYFSSDGTEIHPSALPMYREGWIISALCAKENEKTFVQMLVRAEMKKMNRYHVYLVLETDGNVVGAHCECAAGGGSAARCKHVATSLYGLEALTRTGKIQVEMTCTQTKQKWHAPRRGQAVSSPTKAAKISYKVHNLADKPASHEQHQQDEQVQGIPGEQDRLIDLIKNYQVGNDICGYV